MFFLLSLVGAHYFFFFGLFTDCLEYSSLLLKAQWQAQSHYVLVLFVNIRETTTIMKKDRVITSRNNFLSSPSLTFSPISDLSGIVYISFFLFLCVKYSSLLVIWAILSFAFLQKIIKQNSLSPFFHFYLPLVFYCA